MKKLRFFWNEIKASFWFVPVLILLLSILLAIGFVYLDSLLELSKGDTNYFFIVNSTSSARAILSTISGAMIGVAGTVFSVTLVALTLASSQFGPRLIKNFMYIRINQLVLGAYIATFLYCLLVLSTIRETNDYSFIPSISILFAILATVVNILLLIIFIHNIAISIQADKVIADISDFISNQAEGLFPKEFIEEVEGKNIDVITIRSAYSDFIQLKAPKSGYLQYVDQTALRKIASKENTFVELHYRAGDYLIKDQKLGKLYFKEKDKEGDEDLDNEGFDQKKYTNQLVIGKTKSSQQDLEYSIHQLVEIAARALSPGVNDPYTAMSCIDNLCSTICYLATSKFPSKYHFDEEDKLRLVSNVIDFEGVLDAAFNQIRQFSKGSTAVIIRLMEALIVINQFVKKEAQKKAIVKHAEMVLNTAKGSIEEENDLEDLIERSKQLFD
jgi:uncharacterized membrane protein